MNENYVRALTRALTRANQKVKNGGSPENAHTLARHLFLAVAASPEAGAAAGSALESLSVVARVTDLPDDLARRLRSHPEPAVRAVGWRYAYATASVPEWNAAILEEARNADPLVSKAVFSVMAANCPWDDLSDEAVHAILGLKGNRLTVAAARFVVDAGWRPEAARMWRRALPVLNTSRAGDTVRTAILDTLLAGHLPEVVDDEDVCELYRLAAACAYTAPSGRVTHLLREWGQRLDENGTEPDFGPKAVYALRKLQSALMVAPHCRAADLNELRKWIVLRLQGAETPEVLTLINDLCASRPDEVFTRQVDEAATKQLDGLRLAWARLPEEARTHELCRHVLDKLPHARHLCRDVLAHLGADALEVTSAMRCLDRLHLQVKLPQWLCDLDVNLWVRTFRALEDSGPNPTSALWDAHEDAIDAAAADLLADATQWQPRPAAAIAEARAFGPTEWERLTMRQLAYIVESGTAGDATADWLAGVLTDTRLGEGAAAMSMVLLSDTNTRLRDVLTSVEAFV